MKRAFIWGIVLLYLTLLSGCAGLAKAESFDDRLAYVYGSNTAILQAVTSSLRAKMASSQDMEYTITMHGRIKAALDASRAAADAGDMTKAENQIQLAIFTLTTLQEYLRSRNVLKGT